ncbi:DUF4392 domain-containing protein [Microbacterium pseudoresistens]|uniref:D-glutamate cyclase-like C-terminal domain-containing protein n=1 Tax=Microbacterium pseudoresistens TaxID=640634 RepID=A0A7Y9ETG3_9MICO|nr:glutamate cyclase domain-containing protein [Microbacterium pseudoresistens]NYD53613.1 hypothetical protein [Microbacterium pseudoresistens]
MVHIIGEYIDRLATVEMRPAQSNLARGVIHQLYDAVRAKYDSPLVSLAASRIVDTVRPGDSVVILAGAGGPPALPNAEVDGIPGAVAIAKALDYGLGAEVTILTEKRAEDTLRATVRAAGLNVRGRHEDPLAHCVTWEESPIDRVDAALHAEDVLDRLSPAVIVAIEKLAPNIHGIIHGATGLDYDAVHTKPDEYFDRAASRGILTFGIGDGGNEAGFGVAHDEVMDIMPSGRTCLCQCGGGSATTVPADLFMVAAISDWGGYAFGAMVSYLTGVASAMLTPAEVERMLRACIDAGALDGVLGVPVIADDGVPLLTQRAYVQMLNDLVAVASTTLESPGH